MKSFRANITDFVSEVNWARTTTAFLCSLSFVLCSTANAEILAHCALSEGQSKYLSENPTIDFENFTDDGMSSLLFALNYKNEAGRGNYYIDYKIGEGDWQRTRYPTYMLNYNPSNETYLVMVDASPEGYVETYLFRLDGDNPNAKGNAKIGEVVWTQSRNGGTPKASMFRAPCLYK